MSWVVRMANQEAMECLHHVFCGVVRDHFGHPRCVYHRWEPPEINTLKLNFDRSFCQDLLLGGAGFVLRNHQGQGQVLRAGWCSHQAASPLEAEHLSLWAGLNALGTDFIVNRIVVEGDSLSTIHSLNEEISFLSFGIVCN